LNNEQIIKKYELELYSLGIAKQYALRHLHLVEGEIEIVQKVLAEKKMETATFVGGKDVKL